MHGVDLNHNFDAGWDTLNPTLNHNSFTDYKGPSLCPSRNHRRWQIWPRTHSLPSSITMQWRVLYWDTEGNQKAAESYDMALAASELGYQVLPARRRRL